jgi:hypothetical protein
MGVASTIANLDAEAGGTDRVGRAAKRVTLACRALSEATNELRVAHRQSGMATTDDAADQVGAETERVCELAGELEKLATNLGSRRLVSAARRSATRGPGIKL